MQRCVRPWFQDRIREGDLLARDLTIWLWVASATDLKDGVARVTCLSLARDLNYGHWGHVSEALKRLQEQGAIQRVKQGHYMPSPFLMRAGGPGRHREWFLKWDQLLRDRAARGKSSGQTYAEWLRSGGRGKATAS